MLAPLCFTIGAGIPTEQDGNILFCYAEEQLQYQHKGKNMNKQIKLNYNAFVCQHCGSDYTHHKMVEVFNCAEDKQHDRISITSCDDFADNKYELSIDQQGQNPSLRRSGIRITIECEQCPDLSKLVVYQHKGQTFVEVEQ